MKYEDLTRIYWDINKAIAALSDESLYMYYDEIDRLNWCIETIDEELRSLESFEMDL